MFFVDERTRFFSVFLVASLRVLLRSCDVTLQVTSLSFPCPRFASFWTNFLQENSKVSTSLVFSSRLMSQTISNSASTTLVIDGGLVGALLNVGLDDGRVLGLPVGVLEGIKVDVGVKEGIIEGLELTLGAEDGLEDGDVEATQSKKKIQSEIITRSSSLLFWKSVTYDSTNGRRSVKRMAVTTVIQMALRLEFYFEKTSVSAKLEFTVDDNLL